MFTDSRKSALSEIREFRHGTLALISMYRFYLRISLDTGSQLYLSFVNKDFLREKYTFLYTGPCPPALIVRRPGNSGLLGGHNGHF